MSAGDISGPDSPVHETAEARQARLALAALNTPGFAALSAALRTAATAPQPEQALVELAARWTGGFAEIRASWGDEIAAAGKAAGPVTSIRLVHQERHVGALKVAFVPGWQALTPVLAEYALLARLQSAAAGAARRRVGERTLDALLSGHDVPFQTGLGTAPFALAVATLPLAVSEQAQALDLLAAVGEGYFSERRLVGHSTVRGDQAVWLWMTLDLTREARELHLALAASTAQEVRLGVSARHGGADRKMAHAVQGALAQARQAWAATSHPHTYTVFQELDPLYALLSNGHLKILAAQIEARLETLQDDGRVAATLRAYLAHQGSLSELAFSLGIHVNTLRSRLRAAEEVLGARLSDPALLARLYLAFRAESP